jgi:hypothetical protein
LKKREWILVVRAVFFWGQALPLPCLSAFDRQLLNK